VKGATVTNQLKDAVCEGGAKIKVPPFIENGEVVKVQRETTPYTTYPISSIKPAIYVVEVLAGFTEKNDIQEGYRIDWHRIQEGS
jgi:uncharacterized membrane protein (UPF0127 family)